MAAVTAGRPPVPKGFGSWAEYHREWRRHRVEVDPGFLEYERLTYRDYIRRKVVEDPEWWARRKNERREYNRNHYVPHPRPKVLPEASASDPGGYQRKVKLLALNAYGGSCRCCGVSDPDVLSIDHIDNGRPEGCVKLRAAQLYLWLRRSNYPVGFRTLCFNCNVSLGRMGYCPHNVLPPQAIGQSVPLAGRAASSRRHDFKLRKQVLAGYGNSCRRCGEVIWEFLQVDHANNDGASRRRSMSFSLMAKLCRDSFPPDFQLLCSNCNWKKHVSRIRKWSN